MRLLLVDDERLILEELITITDWKRIGISHIETAGNVEQAKGIIRNYRPDIILCDIEMPQSSGLELLAWCKDNAPETETIILTCHAQFSYAQTGLSAEASHGGHADQGDPIRRRENTKEALGRGIQQIW